MIAEGTVFERVARVMADVEHIKKGSSSGVSYSYRSVDDLFNEVHVHLAENGLFLSPRVLTYPEPIVELVQDAKQRLMTRCIFMLCIDVYAEDGTMVTWGPGMCQSHDYGDKAVYQAQQNGMKYIVLEALMVPTAEMRDQDMDGRHAPEIAPPPPPPADAVPEDQVDTLKERGKTQVVTLCDGDEDRARALTIEAARAMGLSKGWAASPEAWDKVVAYVKNFVDKAKAARQASAEQTQSEAVLPGPDAVQPEPAAKMEASDEAWAELYDLAGVPDPTIGTIPQIEQRTRRLYALMSGLDVWPADHFHSRLMSWYQAEHWGDLKVKANMQQFASRSFDEAKQDLADFTPEDAA